jgi:hypothetical protein
VAGPGRDHEPNPAPSAAIMTMLTQHRHDREQNRSVPS